MGENVKVHNPNAEEPTVYEPHLRSKVPRRVERCQGNCGKKLIPSSNEDYLLVKSYGPTSYMRDGKTKRKMDLNIYILTVNVSKSMHFKNMKRHILTIFR